MNKPKVNRHNPVAKFANRINRAATHRDRKNDYNRKPKHRGADQG